MSAKHKLQVLSSLALGLLLAGCDIPPAAMEAATTDTQAAPNEDDFVPSGMSPSDLHEVLQESTEQAELVASLLDSGVNYAMRLEEFRRHVTTGHAAAAAIERHPDAPALDRDVAAIEGLRLLYSGVKTDRTAFEQKLQEEVAARAKDHPDSEATAVGEAMLLELTVLSQEGEHEAKLEALNDFANRRPSSPAGPALYLQYGQMLEKANDVSAAMEIYRTALAKFPTSTQLNSVRERIAAIEAAHRKKMAKEAAHKAKIASIKRKLVRQDGYFVIYSREKDKTMYRFEYDVLKGADAAANHILHLPNTWEWELTQRFPETADGYTRAAELRDERIKKETFMQIPVFN